MLPIDLLLIQKYAFWRISFVLVFSIMFFPAAIMVFWKHRLLHEENNLKTMLAGYTFSVVLTSLIVVAYFFFGSQESLIDKINGYINFTRQYLLLSLVLAIVLPWGWVKRTYFYSLFKGKADPATSIPKPRGSRKLYLDLIRAVSIFLVIFNHTGIKGFMLYSVATQSPLYPFYMFLSVACKPAVPLFWMVSGALLLPKEESIGRVYRHRVLRMVIVLVLFSAIYYGWQIFLRGGGN